MDTTQTSEPVKKYSAPGGLKAILRFWWIAAGYGFPFLVYYIVSGYRDGKPDIESCYQAGQLGLLAAFLVWLFWRADVRFGGRTSIARSEMAVKVLIHLSGIALWVCWLSTFVVINMAVHQITDLPTNLPNLPE